MLDFTFDPQKDSRPSSGHTLDANSTGGLDILRRAGLSVVSTNDDFDRKARTEAADANVQLDALRQQAQIRAARCRGELELVVHQAKIEEEKRMLSDKVDKELNGLREELRQRDALEEERLGHVYRNFLGPSQPSFPSEAPAAHVGNRGYDMFPSVIYSGESLLQDEDDASSLNPSCNYSADQRSNGYSSTPRSTHFADVAIQDDASYAALRSKYGLGLEDHSNLYGSKPRSKRAVDGYSRSGNASEARERNPCHDRDARAPPVPQRHSEKASAVDPAQKLLQLNLDRLERLSKFGL